MKRGDVISGRYTLREELGAGGMGVVWEAWQSGVERRVAIKFLKGVTSDDTRLRFDVEARALGRLNHPHCVTVHDFGRTEAGVTFIVMEHLEGFSAQQWRGQKLPIHDVVEIGKQIAAALAYAHRQGVVHRDLKPENVFCVDTFDGGQRIKVLDFGLAKLSGREPTDITVSGDVFGTPAYMSPEQLRGTKDAGPAADLYSLGVMLYELIDGRLPFRGSSVLEIGMAHITDPVPPFRRQPLPVDLVNIVNKLLAKDVRDRYGDAWEVYQALSDVTTSPDESTIRLLIADVPEPTASELPDAFAVTKTDIVEETARLPNMVHADQSRDTVVDDDPAFEESQIPTQPREPQRVTRGPLLALGGLLFVALMLGGVLLTDESPTVQRNEPPLSDESTREPEVVPDPEPVAELAEEDSPAPGAGEGDEVAERAPPAPKVESAPPRAKRDKRPTKTRPKPRAATSESKPAAEQPTHGSVANEKKLENLLE